MWDIQDINVFQHESVRLTTNSYYCCLVKIIAFINKWLLLFSMKEKIRIGILGCGFIGTIHADVLKELDSYHVVCVADLKEEAASATAKDLPDVSFFKDYREAIDKKARNLDAVIIALPNTLHLEATKASLEAGLAVLLEKPMGINLEQARAIRDTYSQHNANLMISMTGRYHPEFVKAYNALREGEIGEPLFFNERIHSGGTPFPMQYLDETLAGKGVGLTQGIHTIDRFLWFSGANIVDVRLDHHGNEFFHKRLEDNVRGQALFSDQKEGVFSLRWSPHSEEDYVFEVMGSEGIIRVHGFEKAVVLKGNKTNVLYQHDMAQDIRARHKPGIKAELSAFAQLLLSGNCINDTINNHILDCLKAQEVIDKFYK